MNQFAESFAIYAKYVTSFFLPKSLAFQIKLVATNRNLYDSTIMLALNGRIKYDRNVPILT